ncbi:MAG: hypothetical protein HY553_06690 [Elusimicrobia bacterium]|nr:hypothetical protein [Elusimicrobiota bacterium]
MPDREAYLGEPWQDWLLLVLAPVLACAVGIGSAWVYALRVGRPGFHESLAFFALTGFIVNSHFALTFYRSHLNGKIFRLTPLRFTLVPVLLLACLLTSNFCFCVAVFVNVWWDTWHSSSQTFGLCRMYDRKLGNDPEAGRGLDMALNWLIYTGPIIAGVIRQEEIANSLGAMEGSYPALAALLAAAVGRVLERAAPLVLPAGLAFAAYYAWRYRRLAASGYRVSPLKLAILASTLAAAVASWGYNWWGAAMLSMNLFHAVQYYAVVWLAERGNVRDSLGLPSTGWALPAFLAPAAAYGALVALPSTSSLWLMKVSVAVATLHFWYDGFVWSVRKGQTRFPAPS